MEDRILLSRTFRVLRLVLSHALVAALASCTTFFWVSFKPQLVPPLLQGINPPQAQAVFNERLVHLFPIGSAASDLMKELAENGFQIQPTAAPWRGTSYDNRKAPGFDICGRSATVRWVEDVAGNLTKLAGNYSIVCS